MGPGGEGFGSGSVRVGWLFLSFCVRVQVVSYMTSIFGFCGGGGAVCVCVWVCFDKILTEVSSHSAGPTPTVASNYAFGNRFRETAITSEARFPTSR